MASLKECHICGAETEEDDGFVCSDCGNFTCNGCGDSDLCSYCVGDELFIADILDLEE